MESVTARLVLLLCIAFLGTHAYANVGVPPVASTMFGVVLWLIPIVILETVILGKRLSIPAKSMILGVVAANVASTVAGFLFAFLEEYVEIPFLPARLVGGTVEDFVTLLLLMPFFLMSVAIELPILRWTKEALDADALRRAVVLANIGSYLLIAAFLVGRMVKSAIVHGTFIVRFSY